MINTTIPLSEIDFEEEEPGALLESIEQRGIAIPVAVVHNSGRYTCIDGRKRLTAARRLLQKKAGIERIPAAIHQDHAHAGNAFWGAKNHH